MNNFYEEYRELDNDDLKQRFSALSGQIDKGSKHHNSREIAQQRSEAIKQIMVERGILSEPETQATPDRQQRKEAPDPIPFDVLVSKALASKYSNARQRGIEFTLTFSDMSRLMSRKKCFYTGLVMETKRGDETYPVPARYRSFDRLDPNKGYTRENTVMCCHFINQLKNHLFEDDSSLLYSDPKHVIRLAEKVMRYMK